MKTGANGGGFAERSHAPPSIPLLTYPGRISRRARDRRSHWLVDREWKRNREEQVKIREKGKEREKEERR